LRPVGEVVRLASRRPVPSVVAPYLEHGAGDELQARVWYLRDQLDVGWARVASVLNGNGERRPDGQPWTLSTARRHFGEPGWRLRDDHPSTR
jgi:hypothetical protein